MDGHDTDDPKQGTVDMTVFGTKSASANAIQVPGNVRLHHFKVDETGNRIDELEQSINDLRAERGQEDLHQ